MTFHHAWECGSRKRDTLVLMCPFCGAEVREGDPEIGATIFGPCPGPAKP